MATRSSPGRPPLRVDRIIAAAVVLVDEEGVDALSMRGLAQALGSGTATLYRHFSGRAELVAHVVDAVMGEVPNDEDNFRALAWQRALELSAGNMFDVLCRHPNVATLMAEQIPVGPNALAMRERALGTLMAAGFPPHLAVRAWSTLARYVLGFATQLNSVSQQRPKAWDLLDASDFPASLAVAEHVPVPLREEFDFGLELLLIGLEHHART